MFRLPRTKLDDVVTNLVAARTFFQKVDLRIVSGRHFLKRSNQLAARAKTQLDKKWDMIVSGNVEAQLDRALILDDSDLLVERLNVAHSSIWEIQFAPEAKITRGRERIIAFRISLVRG